MLDGVDPSVSPLSASPNAHDVMAEIFLRFEGSSMRGAGARRIPSYRVEIPTLCSLEVS